MSEGEKRDMDHAESDEKGCPLNNMAIKQFVGIVLLGGYQKKLLVEYDIDDQEFKCLECRDLPTFKSLPDYLSHAGSKHDFHAKITGRTN